MENRCRTFFSFALCFVVGSIQLSPNNSVKIWVRNSFCLECYLSSYYYPTIYPPTLITKLSPGQFLFIPIKVFSIPQTCSWVVTCSVFDPLTHCVHCFKCSSDPSACFSWKQNAKNELIILMSVTFNEFIIFYCSILKTTLWRVTGNGTKRDILPLSYLVFLSSH